ncbi:DUF302 domain-containing protein [Halarcobacter sp.]|uniref:DUF302 domain-containing protein n=1 Tax=Halarcobacter sp. TaxID=2321133 RepID=UPI0029F51B68|nr:DUF302 domain-containing protein [Halarcobacter sp.]
MHYIEQSNKSVDEVVNAIKEKAPSYKFGVLHVHEIDNTLKSKGLEFTKECKVLDVCNPGFAKKLLDEDMSFSVILPCKIAVYSQDGDTIIGMNSIVQLIDDVNPDMIETAQEIQDILLKLISDVK